MLPKEPPRVGQMGFLFVPPYRVQGISIAGEMSRAAASWEPAKGTET